VPLQTAKLDQVACFQSVAQKTSESWRKLSGNFTNAQTEAMPLSPTKYGIYKQSANGSERATEEVQKAGPAL
jgi:hypothetical protein